MYIICNISNLCATIANIFNGNISLFEDNHIPELKLSYSLEPSVSLQCHTLKIACRRSHVHYNANHALLYTVFYKMPVSGISNQLLMLRSHECCFYNLVFFPPQSLR